MSVMSQKIMSVVILLVLIGAFAYAVQNMATNNNVPVPVNQNSNIVTNTNALTRAVYTNSTLGITFEPGALFANITTAGDGFWFPLDLEKNLGAIRFSYASPSVPRLVSSVSQLMMYKSISTGTQCTDAVVGYEGYSKTAASLTTNSGIPLLHRIAGDCGAGTCFSVDQYAVSKDGFCYRVLLVTKTTNPGAVYEDVSTVQQVEKNNTLFQTLFLADGQQVVKTIQFK